MEVREDGELVAATLAGLKRQLWWLRASVILLLTALLVVSAGFVGQRLMLGLLARQNAALRSQYEADSKRISDLESGKPAQFSVIVPPDPVR
jgi:hypothetical protein